MEDMEGKNLKLLVGKMVLESLWVPGIEVSCRYCGCVEGVVKFGFNVTKKCGRQGRYKCKLCDKAFTLSSRVRATKTHSSKLDFRRVVENFPKGMKKCFRSFLDFEIRYNAKYELDNFLKLLIGLSFNNNFAHGGLNVLKEFCEVGKVPASNTLLYHIKKMDPEDLKKRFKRAFNKTLKSAKKQGMFPNNRKGWVVAVDITNIPYYGDKNDFMVCEGKFKNGTTHFFRFITLSIVEDNSRFTLGVLPVHPLDLTHKLLEELVKCAKTKIRINTVLLDRGFFGKMKNRKKLPKGNNFGIIHLLSSINFANYWLSRKRCLRCLSFFVKKNSIYFIVGI